ncbi:proprotein convertase subtilisin/kexin type 5 [Polypterus senegalus]|uniref:proprotein convertase subtilisin/kexin type 5 n=1 Tax=Polypterus senegalus TaxID=55291 RepID=UPI0019658FD4|nr:proprotein convertase subtilisin/kexin type 5 [Polypterus senegalus]
MFKSFISLFYFGQAMNAFASFTCPSGQFALKNQCFNCHATCWECRGHEVFECTRCGIDENGQERFLHRDRCRLHCPRGFYSDRDTFTCKTCMQNCDLCIDVDICTKCKGNYRLKDGSCQTRECDEGQVEDPETGECIDCEIGCKTCLKDDPEFCSSCIEGYFLYRQQCRHRCPQKTYEDNERHMCFACPKHCNDCRGETQCFSCQDGYYLSDGICVDQCPNGTYEDSNSWRCESCHSSCQTCNGPLARDCRVCPDGNMPIYGQCPSVSCKEGQYLEVTDGGCYSCDFSCMTCFGPQALDCSSCYVGFFLDQEGSCVEQCPPGFFANPASLLCEECAPNCETCQDSMDNCLSCRKDGYSLFLYEGSCWSNCPDGYFGSPEDTCEVCDSLCLTCEESKSKCLSCVPYFYLENGQCTANCSYNYYPDEDGTCRRCPAHCDLCRDGTGCTECSYLYLLLDGICKATCPEGYFEDFDQGKCVQCHPTCATCSGTTYNDCDSCSIYYPKLYEGQCFEQCPDGTYELSSEQCQECDQTCSKCTGPDPTDCTKCKKGLALDPNSMMCGVIGDSECPPKMFLHEKLFSCIACHDLCESCHGQESYDCDTCLLPSYFYNGSCLPECPPGMFKSSEEADGVELGLCSPCDHVCATCTDASSKDCLTCASGFVKFQSLCVANCPNGFYRGKSQCEKCDPSCQSCSGPGPEDCLCPPQAFQLQDTKLCAERCPERFYQESRVCKPCHSSCKTCKDSTPQGCLTCDWGSTLLDGVCYPRCAEQRYLSKKEICELCDDSCRHCFGPSPNQCLTCKADFALHPTQRRCITCCNTETNQTDCCLCNGNSAFCIEHLDHSQAKNIIVEESEALGILNYSSSIPTVTIMVIASGILIIALLHARSRKKLCWKHMYERLDGSGEAKSSYDMEHGVPDPDDSSDETDVVYASKDGTIFRRYNLIKANTEKDEEYEAKSAYLTKC